MTTVNRGVPIKERSADDVRDALDGQEQEVVDNFVRLHDYARKHNLGLSKLAAQTGISQSVLSQGFNGDYDDKGGNYETTAKAIGTFFWRLEQKSIYGGLKEFVETSMARTLWKVFEKTRVIRRIQPVQSPEQVGKTRIGQEYTHRNNSGRTRYFTFSKSIENMNDFIHCFAESLGVARWTKLREKKGEIRDQLTACDLIILDEVHLAFKLGHREACKILDYIRTDLFENGERGIVLLCTDDREVGQFMECLLRVKRDYRYNIGQFLGRTHNDVVYIDPAEDITEDDVALLVGRYYKPGKPLLRELTAIAQADQLGHLGLVDDIMTESWTRAKARKKDLSDDIVAAVLVGVRDTIKARKELYS